MVTRFPPEPNGYLHIGHAKSICLNFGIAAEFGGHVQSPVRRHQPRRTRSRSTSRRSRRTCAGSGFDWDEHLYFASDYFEQLYDWAVELIRKGKAYVDNLTDDEIREYRGTLTEPGPQQPVPRPLRRGEPRPVRPHAGRRVPGRRARAAREDRHGLAEHEHARPAALPHPARHPPPHRATPGASTRSTTAPTARRMRSRASRTRSARWSSRTTGRSTTGSWRHLPFPSRRGRSSSPG